jgi:hypothetical protein
LLRRLRLLAKTRLTVLLVIARSERVTHGVPLPLVGRG